MTETLIIGGGLIGMLTARYLAQAGVRVAIYERGEVGRESSWAGGGILSPLYPWRYPDAVTELARWGQQRYAKLAAELQAESGVDPEYRTSGLLLLDIDEAERRQAAEWGKRFGYRLEYMDAAAIRALQPGLLPSCDHGVWMPEVAQMRNPRLLRALRGSIERLGVVIHEHTAVEDIVITQGRVAGIRLANHEISASQVVVAGGAWSGKLMQRCGFELPVAPVRGQMLLFRAEPGVLEHIVLSGNHYLIPRADGRILAGSTLEYTGFDKATTEQGREELYDFATRLFPPLVQCEVETQWAGLRPGTTDGVPFIGHCCNIEGLFVNAGHFRNGVVIGLASARLLTDQLLQHPAILPDSPYHCS